MKSLKDEIYYYTLNSRYSEQYKKKIKRRLDEFLKFLALETNSSIEEVHLEKIYERKSSNGETLFYLPLKAKLVEQYFLKHLYKSYRWLEESKRALQSFFLYLNRKYDDFPILTEQMNFNIEDYKQEPNKKGKYVPTRHDLLRFLQSLLKNSLNLERDALFFILLQSTGSRPNEIINIKVSEIDFVNETIYRKQTKNKSSKFIILRNGFGEILKRYIEKFCLKAEDYLFNNNGKKISANEFQELYKSYLEDANVPLTTLHKLRHSFATIMAESGAEIFIIQQLLNHNRIHSTSTYIDPNYIRNNGMDLKVNKEIYKHIKKVK